MNYLKHVFLSGLLFALLFCTARVFEIQQEIAVLKEDRMELSHIRYGLFSVDEWKEVIADVASKKIQELEIDDSNRAKLKSDIENVLHQVIDEVQNIVREKNDQSGFKGLVKNVFIDLFVDIDDIKSGIPSYADKIIEYLEQPENREEIKEYLLGKFKQFADETMGYTDYSQLASILKKYDHSEKEACINQISQLEKDLSAKRYISLMFILTSGISFFILMIGGFINSKWEYLICILASLFLLVSGIALPMIDIEAEITSFSFQLAGEPVDFNNQIVFFQSKSILDVVWILLSRGELALIIVALLIFSFSVVIPLLKLFFSVRAILNSKLPQNKVIKFLIFQSS
ncbi:MAG: hypothetical protein AAF487_15160, partial [Bacteroidota bacterium]